MGVQDVAWGMKDWTRNQAGSRVTRRAFQSTLSVQTSLCKQGFESMEQCDQHTLEKAGAGLGLVRGMGLRGSWGEAG